MAEQISGYRQLLAQQYDTYDHWRELCLTHGINVDFSFGNQCWDSCALLWYQYGLGLQTGNGYAYGCWTLMRNQNARPPFELVYGKENIKRGDVIVFDKHGSWYTGHIGYADEDYNGTDTLNCVGQNQGQGIGYGIPSNVKPLSLILLLYYIYHQYLPIVDSDTDIGSFGTPILNNTAVMNEFMNRLVNRIVYTSFENRYYNNPLQVLEGDRIPLGYAGQEIYINPAKGRKYDVNDFAGLLVKYEADVKVQYTSVNMDLQYPVTVSRHKLKQAFVSWDSLDNFIMELSNSLYNGAYIDEYQFTKGLVSSAYKSNQVQIETVTAISSEDTAKAFTVKARELFLNMQTPSTSYNAWNKVGGYGREIVTYSRPEDIVFLVRNDIRAYVDVNVLAMAFNLPYAEAVARMVVVDDLGQKDGKPVKCVVADKDIIQCYDTVNRTGVFENIDLMVINYFAHKQGIMAGCKYANAIVLV